MLSLDDVSSAFYSDGDVSFGAGLLIMAAEVVALFNWLFGRC